MIGVLRITSEKTNIRNSRPSDAVSELPVWGNLWSAASERFQLVAT
jgi:hypothetical protein